MGNIKYSGDWRQAKATPLTREKKEELVKADRLYCLKVEQARREQLARWSKLDRNRPIT